VGEEGGWVRVGLEERGRQGEREKEAIIPRLPMRERERVCVCVCVREREREGESGSERERKRP
jgi:hypothetical protein